MKKKESKKTTTNFSKNLDKWFNIEHENREVEEISNQITDYFAHPAVNNSLLKTVASNPKWIKWKEENLEAEDDEKVHFRVGSAIDCLLTNPDSFNNDFYVANTSKPSGLMGVFIDNLPNGLTEESDIEEFRQAYNKSGYKSKIETIVNNLFTKEICLNYYKAKENSNGKSILSSEDYEEVSIAVSNILSNKIIAFYFSDKFDEDRRIERLLQKAIYFEYKKDSYSIPCKALLDGILIDHDKKTIQPFDLKSTATSVYDFEKSFYTYSYFRQCAFYHMAVQWWLVNEAPEEIKEYEVLPFLFIVTPKKDNGNPALIYKINLSTLEGGLDGTYYNGKRYKGVLELLDNYNWHKTEDFWEVPRDIYENGYMITI